MSGQPRSALPQQRSPRPGGRECTGLLRVRLDPAASKRFNRRLDKLMEDVQAAETPDGEDWGLAAAFYRSPRH